MLLHKQEWQKAVCAYSVSIGCSQLLVEKRCGQSNDYSDALGYETDKAHSFYSIWFEQLPLDDLRHAHEKSGCFDTGTSKDGKGECTNRSYLKINFEQHCNDKICTSLLNILLFALYIDPFSGVGYKSVHRKSFTQFFLA